MGLNQRYGILGGTFDPIHLGHLRTAEEVGEMLNLERVFLIPSANPPHKPNHRITAFAHRLAMAALGAACSPRLEALDIEGRREGYSYSIDTLKELQRICGETSELYFIIGVDAFLEIDSWRDYRGLFEQAHFTVIDRPGYPRERVGGYLARQGLAQPAPDAEGVYTVPCGNRIVLLRTTLMDIASSRIRSMLESNHSIRFLVPEAVHDYIQKQGLYRYAPTA